MYTSGRVRTATRCVQAHLRSPRAVAVSARSRLPDPAPATNQALSRRQLAGTVLAITPFALIGAAQARDLEAARAAAEERKRKLREAADASASSGQDQQVFEDSNYMLGEEARTPNIHTRQGEGARSQVNA